MNIQRRWVVLRLSMEKDIPEEALRKFYEKKRIGKYEGRFEALHYAVTHSDYIVTAWDGIKLVGILRSTGDYIFSQYINNFLIDEDYNGKGIGSKMLDAYLEAVEDVMDVYIITGRKITQSFTINWFKYKGFELVEIKDDLQVFKRTNTPEE